MENFLGKFRPTDLRRAFRYVEAGRVLNLTTNDSQRQVEAVVMGNDDYKVRLYYHPPLGWRATCTCPAGVYCRHIAASAIAWREIGDGAMMPDAPPFGSAGGKPAKPIMPEPMPVHPFVMELRRKLGRNLTLAEGNWVTQLLGLYAAYRNNRALTYYDLLALGFSISKYSWEPLRIFPANLKSEKEFWEVLAEFVSSQGLPIPEFMRPMTNWELVQQRQKAWQRRLSIENWRSHLSNLAQSRDLGHPSAPVVEQIDLRLVLTEAEAFIEWQAGPGEEFKRMRPNKAGHLPNDLVNGACRMQPEALALWHLFGLRRNQYYYRQEIHLDYSGPDDLKIINLLLRDESLASRVVNLNRQPFARSPVPIGWQLTPAEDENQDYQLVLSRQDGAPLPPAFLVLPGRPTLYVTADTIFSDPHNWPPFLNAKPPILIPAPALETREGLSLLHLLGLEMPPRLRAKVRHVALRPLIQCALAPLYEGSKKEKCLFKVLAVSEDGVELQQYDGTNWYSASSSSGLSAKGLVFYDRQQLEAVPALLARLPLKHDNYGGGLCLKLDKEFPALFAGWLKSLPPQIKVELAGELASLMNDTVVGSVNLMVTEAEIDWFDLKVAVTTGDTDLTPQEIRLLLKAKGQYVRLEGKGWKRLAFNLTPEEDEHLARLGLSPHELTDEPQRLHALQLADQAARKFLPPEQTEKIERRVSEIKARVTPEVPAGISAELRPYQREGFHFLSYLATNRFGGILADDMGLGKTLQALTWLAWLRANGHTPDEGGNGLAPSLVVCPKSVMDNWRTEAARFASVLRVRVWSAAELSLLPEQAAEADLHVINYSQLRMLETEIARVSWLAAILDEGQYIKNPNSQTAQVARTLKARHRLVLSGTPIENRLLDLWSLMAFAMPGALGSRAEFTRIYDAKTDPLARRRLACRVRPFLLRRTKTQVAKDLPDRVEEDLFCELEGEQLSLYRAELKVAQQLLLGVKTQKQLNAERFNFLTSLLRLRQICCHPKLVVPKSKLMGAKAEALLEQLEPLMAEGEKVLVFSQFVELLELLKPLLKTREWPVFCLTGETENRGELIANFQAHQGEAVFLLSLKAGGFGLNLTAASYVVLFDPWWNPAVERQAIDRTHRIGQTQKVIAYRLLIKNSIEEKIRALQKQKASLAEDVLGEEKFAQALTLDDLRYLLAD